jgi:hypothetical protein
LYETEQTNDIADADSALQNALALADNIRLPGYSMSDVRSSDHTSAQ